MSGGSEVSPLFLSGDMGCEGKMARLVLNCPTEVFRLGGTGGHFIAVIPGLNMVVVHRVNTDDPAKKVTLDQFGQLLHLIVAAKKH
jgi:hypothetical protein